MMQCREIVGRQLTAICTKLLKLFSIKLMIEQAEISVEMISVGRKDANALLMKTRSIFQRAMVKKRDETH